MIGISVGCPILLAKKEPQKTMKFNSESVVFSWQQFHPVNGYVIRRFGPPQFVISAGDSVRRPTVYQGIVESVPSPITVQLCDSTGEWRYQYTTLPPLAVGDTVFFESTEAALFFERYYLPTRTTGLLLKKQ